MRKNVSSPFGILEYLVCSSLFRSLKSLFSPLDLTTVITWRNSLFRILFTPVANSCHVLFIVVFTLVANFGHVLLIVVKLLVVVVTGGLLFAVIFILFFSRF